MVSSIIRRTAAFARFRDQERGAVAVEFAVMLPFLATMLLASIEVSSWLWARDRVVDAAAAVGDLTAQSTAVDETMIKSIFKASDAMLSNDSALDAKVGERTGRVTAVLSCKCDKTPKSDWCFSVLWSHSYDGANLSNGYAVGDKLTFVPQSMGIVEGSTLIVSELNYTFYPKIRFVLETASFDQSERLYYRPRITERIDHLGAQAKTPALVCS